MTEYKKYANKLNWLKNICKKNYFSQHFDLCKNNLKASWELIGMLVKVARYSFSGPKPPKFEHKVRRHKQSFGKIATTVVLDNDESLL